jgi:hypothetical protein
MIDRETNKGKKCEQQQSSTGRSSVSDVTIAPSFYETLVVPALAISVLLIFLFPLSEEGPNTIGEGAVSSLIVAILALGLGGFCGFCFGSAYRALFFVGLAIRLLALGAFYTLSPATSTHPEHGVTTPTMMVWMDDVHYVGAAEVLLFDTASGDGLEESIFGGEKVLRVARAIATYKTVLGNDQVWVRLIHSLIGALVVVVASRGVVGILPPEAERWTVAMICFGPQFIESSILLYKEGYAILAGSLSLLGYAAMLRSRGASAGGFFIVVIATILMYWCRRELAPLVVAGGVGCFLFERVGRKLLLSAAVLAVVGFGLNLWVSNDDVAIAERAQSQLLEASDFADAKAFGWAAGLTGPARFVHIPIALINPPPFNLKAYIFPQLGDDEWARTLFREMRTLQWWLLLPWFFLGILSLAKNYRSIIWPLSLLFLITLAMTAFIYNGNHPEAVRYRSTFLPMAVLISGYGYSQRRTEGANFIVRATYVLGILIAVAMGIRA